MKNLIFILTIICWNTTVFAQTKKVGGPCEGCEAIYENTIPFEKLESVVKLPGASWDGQKPLGINGTVYHADGSPAAGVVLYLYHTDQKGIYPKKGNEKGWGKRHGYLRGWLKTDGKGFYKFVTLRPAAYPDRSEPAHIHITVKEPGINEYYIDEFVFLDDSLLTTEKRVKLENRGGSGIVKLIDVGNMYKGERNIYLGKNIPDYPVKK
ncbi:dioxygenase family protein [Dyadobacter psychrotolerans]|uniref:Intradiol ring-cleavage dioxygenase n=1 Tax=Dyadobacter psychrotolerans TaxID=2541721 RepID=A0A4R5DRH4_9BACT|nr:intradiol ring-cleavage dioxygenase [Dyadobacter psychrotolerans]TDE14830.1 intradiol ring-cleavage dioxygenase [Dyadobacter psychrotolerans]